MRADAEYAARRRHLAKDLEFGRPQTAEEDPRRFRHSRRHGRDRPDRRGAAHQGGNPPRLRISDQIVGRDTRAHPAIDGARPDPRRGQPDQALDPRSLYQGDRRSAGRGRRRLPHGQGFHEAADPQPCQAGQGVQGTEDSDVPALSGRGADRQHPEPYRPAQIRRHHCAERHRGPGGDRRQFRPGDPRAQHRGDRPQDEPRSGGRNRAPVETARPGRPDRHRFHRHGGRPQPPRGRTAPQKRHGERPRAHSDRPDQRVRPAGNVAPAVAAERHGNFEQCLPGLRGQRTDPLDRIDRAHGPARHRRGRNPAAGGRDYGLRAAAGRLLHSEPEARRIDRRRGALRFPRPGRGRRHAGPAGSPDRKDRFPARRGRRRGSGGGRGNQRQAPAAARRAQTARRRGAD